MSTTALRHEEGRLTGERGVPIYHQTWLPTSDPVGVVVIAHGFAEHGGRYAGVAERLVAAGYAVRAADHRGHGRSGGRRTSVVRFADYVADLNTVLSACKKQWPALQIFLVGHSMGGLIALSLAVTHPESLDALVVSAPAACPGEVSRSTIILGKMLSRAVPDLGVLKLPLNRISRDPAVVAAYNADPLVFPTRIRARLGAEMLQTMEQVSDGLPGLRLPLLVMQGTEDGLVDPGCGPMVYERAGSPDKTLKMYDGLWHEIFNEPERDTVLRDLVSWLDARRHWVTVSTNIGAGGDPDRI
ncbi:MAG TPA: lysophospholipase [Candidatus Dormibacteraeota bacterium]